VSRGKAAFSLMTQQLFLLALLAVGVSFLNYHNDALLSSVIGSTTSRWWIASVGTAVHESSHALVALLFGYNIVEFRPFIFNPASPVLGYVHYSYNTNNIVHKIGHFFVGIAPVVLPLLLLFLLYRYLLPSGLTRRPIRWRSILHWRTLLFVLLALQICLHMRCSPADMQNMLLGVPWLILLLLILGLVLPQGQNFLLQTTLRMTTLSLSLAGISYLLLRLITWIW